MLAVTGAEEALPVLIERLTDRSRRVREAAVRALGRMGDIRVLSALAELYMQPGRVGAGVLYDDALRAVEQKIERGATFEPPGRPLRPGISLIAPAYNMDQVIVPSVISLLASDYDPLEVVIVDDGSTDGTLERMIVAFDLVDLPVGDRFQLETEQVERLYISRADPRLYMACKRKAAARTRSMRGSISRGKTGCDHRCGLDTSRRVRSRVLRSANSLRKHERPDDHLRCIRRLPPRPRPRRRRIIESDTGRGHGASDALARAAAPHAA
jgi:hypothetical protein